LCVSARVIFRPSFSRAFGPFLLSPPFSRFFYN
jgi:hypothetical protein